jgi:hypothetical protein
MTTAIEKSVSFLGAVAITTSIYALCFSGESAAKTVTSGASAVQTVTISAKRMNATEKASYDYQQNHQTAQTIVISAKRLSTEAKLAYDQVQASSMQAKVEMRKSTMRTTA